VVRQRGTLKKRNATPTLGGGIRGKLKNRARDGSPAGSRKKFNSNYVFCFPQRGSPKLYLVSEIKSKEGTSGLRENRSCLTHFKKGERVSFTPRAGAWNANTSTPKGGWIRTEGKSRLRGGKKENKRVWGREGSTINKEIKI